MAKRKRASLIMKEGEFKLGFIDLENKQVIELWAHNGFFYQLTKKHKIECEFTVAKDFFPTVSSWLDNLTNVYSSSSKLRDDINNLIRLEA